MGEVWCSHYVIYWGIVVVDQSLRRFSLAPKMKTAVLSTGACRLERDFDQGGEKDGV